MRIEVLIAGVLVAAFPAAAEQRERAPAQQPMVREILYRSASAVTELRGFTLWPAVAPRYDVWPFFHQTGYRIPLRPTIGQVRIAESMPSLLVQGFSPQANWEVVRVRMHAGGNDLRIKKKSMWSSGFLEDDVFRSDDLLPLNLAHAGDGMFSITPAKALEAGPYVLCGEVLERTIMRICYPFEIVASAR